MQLKIARTAKLYHTDLKMREIATKTYVRLLAMIQALIVQRLDNDPCKAHLRLRKDESALTLSSLQNSVRNHTKRETQKGCQPFDL